MRPIRFQPTRAGVLSLLEDCVKASGTDIHLKAPGRPQFRVRDRLVPTVHDCLDAEDMLKIAMTLTELAREEIPLARLTETRFSFGLEGLGRFRVQAVKQRGSWGIVVHALASDAPSLGQVGLDGAAGEAMDGNGGLVLVGGGRARSAVIAALVRQYNQEVPGHLVSIEDPMEYLHRDARAAITQREVGSDVPSVAEGLRTAARLDPDAVAAGDVPDADSAEQLLRLAEEGLLVVAGIAAYDGFEGVRAFIRRFPTVREDEVTTRVAGVLKAHVAAPRVGPAGWQSIGDAERVEIQVGARSVA